MKKFFIFLILLSLIIISCGGGSGGGTSDGATEGEITLAWDSTTDPSVAGYKIYYGTVSRAVSGSYERSTDVGMATQTQTSSNTASYTLRGLTMGRTYYIAITAYDKTHVESNFSNEVNGVAQPVER